MKKDFLNCQTKATLLPLWGIINKEAIDSKAEMEEECCGDRMECMEEGRWCAICLPTDPESQTMYASVLLVWIAWFHNYFQPSLFWILAAQKNSEVYLYLLLSHRKHFQEDPCGLVGDFGCE